MLSAFTLALASTSILTEANWLAATARCSAVLKELVVEMSCNFSYKLVCIPGAAGS